MDPRNGSYYDYHFTIKQLAEEFENYFKLGEITKKYITFSIPIKKKLKKLIKEEMKSQKPLPTDYNILIGQDFWQAHYQILLII